MSDGSWVPSLFLDNDRQHIPAFAKVIFAWVRKVLCIAEMHMSLGAV